LVPLSSPVTKGTTVSVDAERGLTMDQAVYKVTNLSYTDLLDVVESIRPDAFLQTNYQVASARELARRDRKALGILKASGA
jgi:hypothetical protein